MLLLVVYNSTLKTIKIPSLFSLIAGNLEKRAVFTCISRRPTCEVGRRLVLLFYEDEARCLNAIEWSSGPLAALTDAARWASWQLWSSWGNEFKSNNWRHKFQPRGGRVGCAVCHALYRGDWLNLPAGLEALHTSFASAKMTPKSVASSNCTVCWAKKRLGSVGLFSPWASAKKQSYTPTVRNNLNPWLIFSVQLANRLAVPPRWCVAASSPCRGVTLRNSCKTAQISRFSSFLQVSRYQWEERRDFDNIMGGGF